MTKLSEKDIARLKSLWKMGASPDGLALRFKLSEAEVVAICTGVPVLKPASAQPKKPRKLKPRYLTPKDVRPVVGDLTQDEAAVLKAVQQLGPRHHAYDLVIATGVPLNRVLQARRFLLENRLFVK